MKIKAQDFRVRPGEKADLCDTPTSVKPYYKSKKRYRKLLGKYVDALSSLQRLHYASGHYALLLIFQGTVSSATVAILMIRPQRRTCMPGTAARQRCTTPWRLRSIIS